MSRLNWVESLTSEVLPDVETPESWIYWSLLTCISAAAGNNYTLPLFNGKVVFRPNIYVILLGESGLGKGFPVSLAKRLVDEAKVTRIIAGRSSIQAIIQELSRAKQIEGQPLIRDSRGYILNGELGSAFISDPQALHIMTDLYDRHYNPDWVNLLKGDGPEKLKEPYITSLFGANPTVFYASIPDDNITGGYVGRTLIIYEEKRSKHVDTFAGNGEAKDDITDIILPKYVPHLKAIAAKGGQIHIADTAKNLFNTWKKKWRDQQAADKTGFLNRVPDHILKVSMCLALADWDLSGEVTELMMEESIQKVTALIYSNKRTTEGRGPDPLAAATKMVLDLLIAAPEQKLTRKHLLWKGYGTFNSFLLDQIIENLSEMGWCKKCKIGSGGSLDWEYYLAGEPLESYKSYVKSREKK